jgi:hypothetical protein
MKRQPAPSLSYPWAVVDVRPQLPTDPATAVAVARTHPEAPPETTHPFAGVLIEDPSTWVVCFMRSATDDPTNAQLRFRVTPNGDVTTGQD